MNSVGQFLQLLLILKPVSKALSQKFKYVQPIGGKVEYHGQSKGDGWVTT